MKLWFRITLIFGMVIAPWIVINSAQGADLPKLTDSLANGQLTGSGYQVVNGKLVYKGAKAKFEDGS